MCIDLEDEVEEVCMLDQIIRYLEVEDSMIHLVVVEEKTCQGKKKDRIHMWKIRWETKRET